MDYHFSDDTQVPHATTSTNLIQLNIALSVPRKIIIMQIMTKPILAQLKKNFETESMQPAMKLFNPAGCQTWLIATLAPDGDTVQMYADLGFDCVEWGTGSLKEILNLRLPFGMKIERDRYFDGKKLIPSELLQRKNLSGL